MLRRIGIICIITFAMAAGSLVAQDALTLDEAIATAVKNNPGLAVARERVERVKNQWREAKGQAMFKLSGQATYTHITPTTPATKEFRPPNSTTASATLAQPIDISGQFSLIRKLAGLQLDIQEYGEAQTLQQLILDVKSAYYNVLRAQGGVDVAQSSINAAEERLRVAKAQFDAGVAAKFDVTRAEVDVANRRQTLIQAENGVDLTKAALNLVMGIEVANPVAPEPQQISIEPVTIDIPTETSRALQARPEMQQAKTAVSMAEHSVSLASKGDMPSLALAANVGWTNTTTAFTPNNITYTYIANVSWPIWSGGVTKAKVAEAKNDASIARKNLEQATLGVQLDVRNAALSLMEASKRVGTAQANVAQAEEALRLARVRYQEGVSTQVEVSDVEEALTLAQTNLVNSRYDFLNNQAELQRATATQPEYKALTTSNSEPKTPVSEGTDK